MLPIADAQGALSFTLSLVSTDRHNWFGADDENLRRRSTHIV